MGNLSKVSQYVSISTHKHTAEKASDAPRPGVQPLRAVQLIRLLQRGDTPRRHPQELRVVCRKKEKRESHQRERGSQPRHAERQRKAPKERERERERVRTPVAVGNMALDKRGHSQCDDNRALVGPLLDDVSTRPGPLVSNQDGKEDGDRGKRTKIAL